MDVILARLSQRQRTLLRLIVKSYVEDAGPIGSSMLKTRYRLAMSPATIRAEMNRLEQFGLLSHPFTSAGRIPTKLGYQAFVNELMEVATLSEEDRAIMQSELLTAAKDAKTLIRESSRILSRLSRLLGVVMSPDINQGVLERLEIVPLASDKVMFVISVQGGFIRTILMQVDSVLDRSQLDRLVTLLNERLAGLTLDEIRRTCVPRIQDLSDDETGLVQLIVDQSADLFNDEADPGSIQINGATYILSQPEFSDSAPVKDLIDLLDDQQSLTFMVAQSLEGRSSPSRIAGVQIGVDTEHPSSTRLSVVSAPYIRSNLRGTVSVIGPTRMNYPRAVALVEGISTLMSMTGTQDHLA